MSSFLPPKSSLPNIAICGLVGMILGGICGTIVDSRIVDTDGVPGIVFPVLFAIFGLPFGLWIGEGKYAAQEPDKKSNTYPERRRER